ncbi:MAG TPA: ABC transporter permease [Anaerolineae bacterium]|nr:ABC transporter permease [Anaerolineales bacterium]HRV94665.1 ABC transporter permease [Anaerolineae bacterium]
MAAATQKAASPTTDLDRRERSPLGDAFRQLLKNKVAVASGIFIILLIFLAIFADYFNAYALQGFNDALGPNQPPYAKQVLQDNNARPGTESKNPSLEGFVYWLGADNLGRDLWTRTLYGTRVSMAVALVAGTVSLVVGVTYGIVAGYLGGRADDLMMRIVDFLYGLPLLIVVILVQVYFKSLDRSNEATGLVSYLVDIDQAMGGLFFIFVILGALSWLSMARIARGQTLSIKEKEFVEAAQSIGARPQRIIFKQILPNILGPCLVQETLEIPGYILTEAFLSFIGLGVNAPTPSWGIMINEAFQGLRSHPYALIPPAVALTLTVLAFNFLGDGLRDAFDPRLRE